MTQPLSGLLDVESSCNILLLKLIGSICLKIFGRLPLNIDDQFRRPTVPIQMRRKPGQSFRAPSSISREAVPLICWNPCGFRAPRRVSSPSAPSRPPPQPAFEMCLRSLGALPRIELHNREDRRNRQHGWLSAQRLPNNANNAAVAPAMSGPVPVQQHPFYTLTQSAELILRGGHNRL